LLDYIIVFVFVLLEGVGGKIVENGFGPFDFLGVVGGCIPNLYGNGQTMETLP
jgi:hypothetical protein